MSESPREQMKREAREREAGGARWDAFCDATRTVAATPEGKALLSWIVKQGDIFKETSGEHADGVRVVPLKLLAHLRQCANWEDYAEICLGKENRNG